MSMKNRLAKLERLQGDGNCPHCPPTMLFVFEEGNVPDPLPAPCCERCGRSVPRIIVEELVVVGPTELGQPDS